MSKKTLTMLAVGDLIMETSQPDEPFALVAPVLQSSDVVVGQGEVPFTSRGVKTFVDPFCNANPCDPNNIKALAAAGFNVITLAGNHIWDAGAPGIEDTIAGLKECGITHVGAGLNIDEARKPVVIEREGTRFGFLSYNCAGPIGSWATPAKPGCAYVQIITGYESGVPVPGGYPTIYTFPEPRSLKAMEEDIRNLRPCCDVLVVALHKGVGFLPAVLAMYEQQVSHAAIDAGADLILGHHAHILKGIEVYKGKVIFHGLSNFVVVTELDRKTYYRYGEHYRSGLHEKGKKSPEEQKEHMLEFVRRNGGPFFFERGGKESPFPPPEINLTIIAKCTIDGRHISKVSYLPCLINKYGQPEILKNDTRGEQVFRYMYNITNAAGLNALFEWEGDEVVIRFK